MLDLVARGDPPPQLSLDLSQVPIEPAPRAHGLLPYRVQLREPVLGGLPRVRGSRRPGGFVLRLGAVQGFLQLGDALVDQPVLRAIAEEVVGAAVPLVLRLQGPQLRLDRPRFGQDLLDVRPGVLVADRPGEGDHLALHGEDGSRVAVDVRVGLFGDALPAYAGVLAEVLPAGDRGVHGRPRLLLPLLVEGDLLLVLLVPRGETPGLADALRDLVDLGAQTHQLQARLLGLSLPGQLVDLAQAARRIELEALHPRGDAADRVPRLLQALRPLLLRLVRDVRMLRVRAALEVLGRRSVVDTLAPLPRTLRMHARDALEPALDRPDPVVEVPGEPDAFLEVAVGVLRSIGEVGQVCAQLAVLAEHAGALTSERGRLLEPSLEVARIPEALLDRAMHLLQAVVDALRDLEPLPLQLLATRERLLQRAAGLVPARAAPMLVEVDVAGRAQRFVQLRMPEAVTRELFPRDGLDSLPLAFARRFASHPPSVGFPRILHAGVAEALVEVPAIALQPVGGAVAHFQRPLQPVVALAGVVARLGNEMAERIVPHGACHLGCELVDERQTSLEPVAHRQGLVEVALRLGGLARDEDRAPHSLRERLLQPADGAAHGTLRHQLLEPAQRSFEVASLDGQPLQLGELLALQDLLRSLEALEPAQRLEGAGVERVERAARRRLERALEAAAARQRRGRAGQRADPHPRERSQLEERQRAGQRAGARGEQHVLPVLPLADGLDGADGPAHDALHHHAAGNEGGRERESGHEQLARRALQESRGRVIGLLHALPGSAGGVLRLLPDALQSARLVEPLQRQADGRVLRGRLQHRHTEAQALADPARDPGAVQRIEAGVQRAPGDAVGLVRRIAGPVHHGGAELRRAMHPHLREIADRVRDARCRAARRIVQARRFVAGPAGTVLERAVQTPRPGADRLPGVPDARPDRAFHCPRRVLRLVGEVADPAAHRPAGGPREPARRARHVVGGMRDRGRRLVERIARGVLEPAEEPEVRPVSLRAELREQLHGTEQRVRAARLQEVGGEVRDGQPARSLRSLQKVVQRSARRDVGREVAAAVRVERIPERLRRGMRGPAPV